MKNQMMLFTNSIKKKKDKCLDIVVNITHILPILLINRNKKLYKLFEEFFTKNCKKYLIIINNIIYDNLLFIKYKKTKVVLPNKNLYQLISYIRHLDLYMDIY